MSRNGGVGELRVGKRQEMLEIASYGYDLSVSSPSGRMRTDGGGGRERNAITEAIEEERERRRRIELMRRQQQQQQEDQRGMGGRRRADSMGSLDDRETEERRASFYMDPVKARQAERVMDEGPLTDSEGDDYEYRHDGEDGDEQDMDEDGYRYYDAEEHYHEGERMKNEDAYTSEPSLLGTPNNASSNANAGAGGSSATKGRMTPTSGPGRSGTKSPTSNSKSPSTPTQRPGARQRQISASRTPNSTTTSGATAKRAASSSPSPSTPSKSPSSNSRSAASKVIQAKLAAAKKQKMLEGDRRSGVEVWDDVILPIVTRDQGLNGHLETVDGSPGPAKNSMEVEIVPAPGRFQYIPAYHQNGVVMQSVSITDDSNNAEDHTLAYNDLLRSHQSPYQPSSSASCTQFCYLQHMAAVLLWILTTKLVQTPTALPQCPAYAESFGSEFSLPTPNTHTPNSDPEHEHDPTDVVDIPTPNSSSSSSILSPSKSPSSKLDLSSEEQEQHLPSPLAVPTETEKNCQPDTAGWELADEIVQLNIGDTTKEGEDVQIRTPPRSKLASTAVALTESSPLETSLIPSVDSFPSSDHQIVVSHSRGFGGLSSADLRHLQEADEMLLPITTVNNVDFQRTAAAIVVLSFFGPQRYQYPTTSAQQAYPSPPGNQHFNRDDAQPVVYSMQQQRSWANIPQPGIMPASSAHVQARPNNNIPPMPYRQHRLCDGGGLRIFNTILQTRTSLHGATRVQQKSNDTGLSSVTLYSMTSFYNVNHS
ncbi:hypothetical protein K435DRAFT_938657 [Dendrothele bispora CBS 962.96]|uniref:Uncharacterized protein n=1 Tax=Dendrothele bispora (strain CBS 962.96) TaxID=1314807 RepID=A0A4S8MC53_DENBC|nr:hypothetical protein K435DRAFT_938657 [Dendrothele bispora CBS 962.96]